MNDYSDIRSHERYHLKNHIPMPMENRAVQFAPFAALTGYDEEIHEAGTSDRPYGKPVRRCTCHLKSAFPTAFGMRCRTSSGTCHLFPAGFQKRRRLICGVHRAFSVF